ncbi:MarR family transcriptional regulator [Arthrobacter sp. I2-34]|uniref:MarR family transcriptional regulator n=1 Tax=Arthrobacter hankyongi TaxID=2904801 RepID=A0ABS9L9G5_9MICC|nr:MarR family transcriptional regulator [Arthrobacter hankyongi]MCG2623305.1 MarR family transcriptional regulator [Arthrobacter hankyongi]
MNTDGSMELSRQLRPLLTRVYQMVRRRSPGWDVTAAQSSVLTTLLDRGPLRMGELAAVEGVRMPTATSVVARLVKLGLVERTADPQDRRAVQVGLTAQGRIQIDALSAERNANFAELLGRLSAEERGLLQAAMPAMAHLLSLDADPNLAASENDLSTALEGASNHE